MKDYKRLALGAVVGNTVSGVVGVQLVDYDGGEFQLSPKIGDGVLILVDPQRPASYGLQIQGSPEQLRALANALSAVARGTSNADADS